MIKNIYNMTMKVAAAIAVALAMTSCLDKFPGDAIPESEGMKSLSDAEQTVTGIYSAYMSSSLYSGDLSLLPDIQADLVHAVQGNTNVYGNIWQWDIRPTNSNITSIYGALYRVIARCNFYLDQVDELRETMVLDDDITYLDYLTGEVYCARANAYSELIKCFCEAYDPEKAHEQLGVALDSTYFGTKPQRRASLKDSYEFVIRDLKKAEDLLDEDTDVATYPYISQAAVKAIRSRIALYMQEWDKAIEYSTELIENENFSLATSTVIGQGFDYVQQQGNRIYTEIDYMWTYDSADEIIWQIGYQLTSYGGALGQVFLNFNNNYTDFYPDYMPSEWVLGLYSNSDARRAAYFRTLPTGYPGNPSLTLLIKYFGNEPIFISNNIFHVCQPKPLRLAEQYLIRAEAHCENGDFALARTDLTTLAKSRGASVGSFSESNWLDVISNERAKELYMEGFRLHDLKRWNKKFKRVNQSSAQTGSGSTLEIEADDHRFVWPIPQHEVESPGSKIEQNKGY